MREAPEKIYLYLPFNAEHDEHAQWTTDVNDVLLKGKQGTTVFIYDSPTKVRLTTEEKREYVHRPVLEKLDAST